MNILEEIQNCPVEWKELGEVCDTVTDFTAAGSFASNAKNVKYIQEASFAQLVRTTDLKSEFKGNNFVYVDEHAFNYLYRVNLDKESLVMPNVGNCGEIYYINPENLPYENNVLGPNALLVRSSKENNRYLFHLFQSGQFQNKLAKITSNTGQTKYNKTNLKKIRIPIPPLKIQDKIVQILDKFTDYVTELTSELTSRRKQYSFYRDKLLSFEDEVYQVEWKELGEVVDYEQPTKYIVSSKAYTDSDEIPVLTAGQSFILGYTNEKDGIYQASKSNPVIIFDDFTTSKQWVDFKFKVKSSAMKMLTIKDEFKSEVLLRYVWHYLGTITYKPDQHGRQWIGTYSKFLIPILPLEIQEKIVQILDNFDGVCNDLNIGLPKEIELRQKQYEYWREQLLSFNK